MNTTTLLLGAAAAGGLYLVFRKKDEAQHKGDDAQIGDQVWYGIAQVQATLGPNALPQALQLPAGYVIQQVTGIGKGADGGRTLIGPLVGFAFQDDSTTPLPTPTAPVQLPASLAVGVMRGNTRIS